MRNEQINKELALATIVAKSITSKYKTVEFDDIQSNLWLWMMENPSIIEQCRAMEEGGAAYLTTSLRNEAVKFCQKESKTINETLNFYTVERVEEVLAKMWEFDSWSKSQSLQTGSDIIAILADVQNAYQSLATSAHDAKGKKQQALLAAIYRDGYTLEEVAQAQGISKQAVAKQKDAAITRLTNILAGEPIGWVKRPKNNNLYDEGLN